MSDSGSIDGGDGISDAFSWDRDAPLARCQGETRKAHDALQDYWLMGPGRSLRNLYLKYTEDAPERTPTRHLRTLKAWSSRFKWQARVDRAKEIFDENVQKELEARRDEILNTGFALHFERIDALKELADLLYEELQEEDKRWLPDVKQIGAGEDAERVDIVRFNAQIVEQFRRTLDDIAAEKGQRVRGLELRGGIGIAAVTADELARARDEASDWEKERFGDVDSDDDE